MAARSTALGDSVAIDVGQTGPYGAQLKAGPNGNAAVVVAWERLPNGKFGPIQRDGGVRLGDVLWRLNAVDLHDRRFDDVMAMLRNPGILNKRLTFVSKDRYLSLVSSDSKSALMSGDAGSGVSSGATSRASSRRSVSQSKPFMSVVRKARINQENPSAPYAEYEVSCSLRLSSRRVETQRIVRWSVWKRYSEFESLVKAIKNDFGWQLEAKVKTFPAKNNFTWSKLSVDFVEKRRSELDKYWQAMLSVDRIADFSKQHHCSADLMAFLEVSKHVYTPDDRLDDDASKSRKNNMRRRSTRRIKPGSASSRRLSSPPLQESPRQQQQQQEGGRSPSQSQADTLPPPETEQNTAKEPPPSEVVPFLKMLKLGVPRPAVEMKMGMAGVDVTLLDQFSQDDSGSRTTPSSSAMSAPPPPPPPPPRARTAAPAASKSASKAPPPPPPPRPPPARAKGGGGGMPINLLADINKNRID